VAVITQRVAHDLFGNNDPTGQPLEIKAFKTATEPARDAAFQIIGVVADIKNGGPEQPSMPLVFLPYTIRGGFVLLLKTTVPPESLTHAVQQAVWSVDREQIIGLSSSLENFLQKNTYATPEFGLLIAVPLAGIALILVLIGIFCVMAYTVSLRTHEIGVRMALGAQPANVLKMVFVNGIRLIGAGSMIGFGLGYWGSRYLSDRLWGISRTDVWTFASVGIVIMSVGLAACLFPARRAANVDPLVALRYE
jgi:predicted lysophospholipase L1 biosynthesis ABC-type transport system permease subunit